MKSPTAVNTPSSEIVAEHEQHGTKIRVVAVLALAWGAAYLTWRIGWTGHGTNPVMYTTLLAAELFGWISLALFTHLAWRTPTPPAANPSTRPQHVDVLVPTYDEPVEVLRATLIGCNAMTGPHTTWLLDDGRREEMRELADELGARYLTRSDNLHAKAGNINHALPHLTGPLVAVLDADHVPLPNFLSDTAGYFDEDNCVLVQAPHEFYNLDSIQHVAEDRHEQTLFFRVICPGKDRHNSSFWCGSGTVMRLDALKEIGGVQTATIAEDFHTTIVLHQKKWRTRYHNDTLVLGLAPHDLDSFLLQRSRWARGNLRVFLTAQNPLWAKHLTMSQRVSYLGSLLHYFGGPQRLAMLGVLCATLATGILPLHGSPVMFAALWAPWLVLSLAASKLLGRGVGGLIGASRHGWMTMGVYTGAVASLVWPRAGKFKVTPKMGTDQGGWRTLLRLRALTLCTTALGAAAAARTAATLGVVTLPAMPTFALVGTLTIAAVELVVIGAVLRGLTRRRQRRNTWRFAADIGGEIAGEHGRVVDVNATGAGYLTTTPPAAVGDAVTCVLRLPRLDGRTDIVDVDAVVKNVTERDGGMTHTGVVFDNIDPHTLDAIVEYCHVVRPAQTLGGRSVSGDADEPAGRDGNTAQQHAPETPSTT